MLNESVGELRPNLSLKRTRVRRASCGARRHAPLSLVRWASRRCGVHFRPTAATRMQANCQPGLIGLCAY